MSTGLTAADLRKRLDYDQISGEFTWIATRSPRVSPGDRAGRTDGRGYREITIDGRPYKAHRLAWLWIYGSWPVNDIDHINGVRDDNKISNLRDVTRSVNLQNQKRARCDNSCGLLGVSPSHGRWQAEIKTPSMKIHLGTFTSPEAAHAAYLASKEILHEGYVPVDLCKENRDG